jgi:hypothetical protein
MHSHYKSFATSLDSDGGLEKPSHQGYNDSTVGGLEEPSRQGCY